MRSELALKKLAHSIRAPTIWVPKIDFGVNRFLESQRQLAKAFEGLRFGSIFDVTRKLKQLEQQNDVLDRSGWLPHYSTPFGIVDDCKNDSEALDVRLSQFYEERWGEVRREIERRILDYSLDDEAKETLREALQAHEARLYRCVCRVLLPEVERIARVELHDDKIKGIASQPLLKKLAGTLSISSIEPRGWHSLNLLRRLDTHLYERIRFEEDRMRFKRDPIPNRHAAVHGLVVYASMQNSLNAIFMTEFIFQVISALKRMSQIRAN